MANICVSLLKSYVCNFLVRFESYKQLCGGKKKKSTMSSCLNWTSKVCFAFWIPKAKKHNRQKTLKPAYVLLFKKQFYKYGDVVLHRKLMKRETSGSFLIFFISFWQNPFDRIVLVLHTTYRLWFWPAEFLTKHSGIMFLVNFIWIC